MNAKRHLIGYVITFILLFTGICGQKIEANPFLTCTHTDNTVSAIISSSKLTSMDACTTEMISRQSILRLRQANRTTQSRRDFKLVQQIICYIALLNILLKFFKTEDILFFKNADCSKVAIQYIQNKDGKKRN